jgi:hypothetical protein
MTSSQPHPRNRLTRLLLRLLGGSLAGAALLCAIAYVGDWTVFAISGSPTEQVTVVRYLATPLKGNNTEVDFEGRQSVSCARAIFPHSGNQPCWYLRRHPTQFDRP